MYTSMLHVLSLLTPLEQLVA